MEPSRFILMKDVLGYKLNGAVISRLKRVIGDEPHSPVSILRGELVEEVKSDANYNLKVWHDATIMLRCCDDDMALLCSQEEFLLMAGISSSGDRFVAFQEGQIELGLKLGECSEVYVALPGPNLIVKKYAMAVIRYKGTVGNLPGTMFGVEILERDCRLGTSDGTFQEERYFKCKDGYGLFVSLHRLSQHRPDEDNSYRREKLQPSHGVTNSAGLESFTDTSAQSIRSKSMIIESSVDHPSAYQIRNQVSLHDKRPGLFKGIVYRTRIQNSSPPRSRRYGIHLDEEILKTDFGNSVIGLDQLIGPTQKTYALSLPEKLVEEIPIQSESDKQKLMENLASNMAMKLNITLDECVSKQSNVLEEMEVPKIPFEEHKGQQHMTMDEFFSEQMEEAEDTEGSFEEKNEKQHITIDKFLIKQMETEITKSSLEKHKEKPVAMEALVTREDTNNLSQQQDGYRKLEDKSGIGMLQGEMQVITKSASTEHDDRFQRFEEFSPEDDDEFFQESKWQELHQRIDQSQEEIFSTLNKHLINLQVTLLEELKNVCENRDRKIKKMALVIQSNKKEMRRLTGIIQSKDNVVEEMEEVIASRYAVIENMSSTLQDKEIANMKITEELQQMATKIEDLQQQLDKRNEESLLQLRELHDSVAPWKIDRSKITSLPKKQIGCGAWGEVYSAHFKGEPVAIKIAHREVVLGVEGTVDMIKREISIMAHIQHPNLVRFIGAVLDKRVETKMDTPIIVLELLDMDLRVAYGRERLDRNTMPSIFCDVAYALHYLHNQREAIIHRDISAPNILLKRLPNGLFKAKVSDLGSANLVRESRTAGAGALIYTAPEMFPQDITSAPPPQTTKVDVFSYGILLLEVVSKAIPTIDKRYSLLQTLKAKWESIYDLIVCCTQQSPSDRPNMRAILNILNRMHHEHN